MKIAVLNFGSSGLFHYATALVNSLTAQRSGDQLLFATSSKNNLNLVERQNSIQLEAYSVSHKLLPLLLWSANANQQQHFARTIRRFSPDVIHITDALPIYPLHHMLLKKYPIVVTRHDITPHKGDRYRMPTISMNWYLGNVAHAVAVHGMVLKQQLLMHSSITKDRIHVVPLGSHEILIRERPSQTVTIPSSILYFGRIVAYKGLDVLLDSLAILQERGTSFTFILAGPGNLAPYIKKLSQIRSKRIVNEYIPEGEVAKYFFQSEIAAFPHREASQSGALSMALTAGMPVVATTAGAIPEVLNDGYNGLLVPPGDAHALAGAIERLLNSRSLRVELMKGAKVTVQQKISWSIVAPRYREIYQHAIREYDAIHRHSNI